ncbi:MAG: heparinase II/III domain-containing protein, partial [Limisphaerales bacterium]
MSSRKTNRTLAKCPAAFAGLFLASLILTPAAAKAVPWPGKIVLPDFPKPNPVRAFAGWKIFGANGSPIRMPVEDWDGARHRIATNAEWQRWVAGDRARVDDWMAKRRDKVGWIAGWYHNFVSPKDGSFLIFTPDEPGEETLHSPSDPKVKLTPALHAAWVYEFRMKNADMMVEAARLFRLTGETRYAKWAAEQLDFYADNYDQWKVHNGVHFMFQSLDEATILTRWVAAARTLNNYVTAEQKKRWSENLFEPQAHLLEKTFQVIHNIACWQRSAMGQVALYCHDDNLWRAAVNSTYGIRNEVARGVTSDYLWFEQSLGYNGYVVRALTPFFEDAMMAGKGAELQKKMEIVENLLLSPLAMRFPNGQLPNPSDGGKPMRIAGVLLEGATNFPTSANEENDSLAGAWRLFPTRPGLKLLQASHEKNWDTLLDPPPAAPIDFTLPPVTSRNMESTRMAIIHSGPWQVYFHYGQLTASHSQSEALNFEAFYDDVDVTHDPGTTGYGSKFTTEYFRSGVAHNVPLVDGVGQKSWNAGELKNFCATNVAAGQPEYRPDAHAERSLTIDDGELRDAVSITTTDGKTHALGFVLNLQGKAKLPMAFKPDADFLKTHTATAFKFWQNIESMPARDHVGFDVAYGHTMIHVEFNLPGQFTIYHVIAPDDPPHHREAFYLETHGVRATLKTVFSKRAGSNPFRFGCSM